MTAPWHDGGIPLDEAANIPGPLDHRQPREIELGVQMTPRITPEVGWTREADPLYWAGPDGVQIGEEIQLTPAEQTRGRLWVTTDLRYARLIAHLGDRGTVYRVTPVAGAVTTVERAGDVEPTWEVQGLRVDAVIASRVKLGKGWLRKYGAAWLAAGGRPSPAVSRLRIRRVTAGPGLVERP